MPELAEVEPQTTAGFVSRSRSKYKERIAKDEQELKDLLADKENPEQEAEASQEESVVKEEPKEEEESLSPEEKSFKIRYGDLRRHSQQKEKELKDEIERLKNSVNSAPPKTEDELKEWAEKYPDVAGMVETIASKKAKEMFDSANIQIEELAKKEEEATRNRALNDIRKAHKDFDELEKSKDLIDIDNKAKSLLVSEPIHLDYLEILDMNTFSPPKGDSKDFVIIIAVVIEGVRLIDNIRFKYEEIK